MYGLHTFRKCHVYTLWWNPIIVKNLTAFYLQPLYFLRMYLRNLWFLVLFYLSVLIKMVLKIISSPVILLIKSHIFTSCHFRLQIRKSSITCDPDSDFYFCWLLFWKHGVTLWTRNYFPLLQQQLTLVIACLLCPC